MEAHLMLQEHLSNSKASLEYRVFLPFSLDYMQGIKLLLMATLQLPSESISSWTITIFEPIMHAPLDLIPLLL